MPSAVDTRCSEQGFKYFQLAAVVTEERERERCSAHNQLVQALLQ